MFWLDLSREKRRKKEEEKLDSSPTYQSDANKKGGMTVVVYKLNVRLGSYFWDFLTS